MAVQGFLAELVLDGTTLTNFVNVVTMDRTKNVLDKSVQDGSGQSQAIPGKESGTLACTGFLDQATQTLLEATWAKEVAVAFTLTVVEGLTADNSWTGSIVVSDFNVNTGPDDAWGFDITGTTFNVVFTPSTP